MKKRIIIEGKMYKVSLKDYKLADLIQTDCIEARISFAEYIERHYKVEQDLIPTIMY